MEGWEEQEALLDQGEQPLEEEIQGDYPQQPVNALEDCARPKTDHFISYHQNQAQK